MPLATKEFSALLLREADAALQLSHSDICRTLSDELAEMFPGEYPYLRDVFGDDSSGDVVYSCGGETWRAPYEIGTVNSKRTCAIDDDAAINVLPRTVYDEEADEQDHYAGMEPAMAAEAKKMPAWMRRQLFSERFIPKAERDAAESGDFAGKGKSFPILKPGDVMAAVRSMGRAGADNKGTDSLKSSIIRIAKKKGWAKYLPKAWQDQSASAAESRQSSSGNQDSHLRHDDPALGTLAEVQSEQSRTSGRAVVSVERRGTSADSITLVEGAAGFVDELRIREARTDYPVKLISPGTGSTAHYSAEVLKRDGPKIFKPGTLMFWNHPTASEEAARPEGDLNNLAAILTTEARWEDNGVKGPGLYSNAKVMADYSQKIEERAPHIGLSIRAGGTGTGKLINGKPELKSLDYAESVDYVTRAGRGGIALAEAARGAGILIEEVEMTQEETKLAIQEAINAAQKPLLERLRKADAREEATRLLETVTLPAPAKLRIVERACATIPLKDTGEIDLDKFRAAVVAESKAEGEYLARVAPSAVRGFGQAAQIEVAPEEAARRLEEQKRSSAREVEVFQRLGLTESGAKLAAKGRAA